MPIPALPEVAYERLRELAEAEEVSAEELGCQPSLKERQPSETTEAS